MGFREKRLSTGTKIFLGKNSENNDELVSLFKGRDNVILHTVAPGSPFCVIDKLDPAKKEIFEAAAFCALYSQAWRDNKQDILVNVFTGKDVRKRFWMKQGTWNVRKSKIIKVKKSEINKAERMEK